MNDRLFKRSYRPRKLQTLLFAAVGVLAVLSWQAATVHFNYSGNWSALFCTGDFRPIPPELAAKTYVFAHSTGYDGQFYRYVAHHPWPQNDSARYLDDARSRYSRILVPAIAWLLSGGNPNLIDGAYIATVLAAIFLGIYWSGRYVESIGRPAVWGLLFLVLPATLISIDRMTVDAAFMAAFMGALYYDRRDQPIRLYVVLMAAMLVRDTGLLLVIAASAYAFTQRRWKRAACYLSAAAPALLWIYLVATHVAASHLRIVPRWFFRMPLYGIVVGLFRPARYSFGPVLNVTVQILDAIALCGLLLALGMVMWKLRPRKTKMGFEHWIALLFVMLAAATSVPKFWENAYGYARPYSPLLLLAPLLFWPRIPKWGLVPVLMVDLRIAAQVAPQALGILCGLL